MKSLMCYFLLMTAMLFACSSEDAAKAETFSEDTGTTLIAYYSYTGNCRNIVNELTKLVQADVVEITPADKTQRYEANGYAIGTQLLNAIKANPNVAASYPAIDPVALSPGGYDNIIVVTPLWWSQMAAIMQSYLFQYGSQMAGKSVALVVSSASSSFGGVVGDAQRLLPGVEWMGEALWVNNSNRANTVSLLKDWLPTLNFKQQNMERQTMNITIDGQTQPVSLVDNAATRALVERLKEAPLDVTLNTNGDFEIWGPLGLTLPASNESIDAGPGDVVLYAGSNICIFFGSNSYSYTRLGKIEDLTATELKTFLKGGQSNISVTLSLPDATAIGHVNAAKDDDACYSLSGQRLRMGAPAQGRKGQTARGVYIKGGKKMVL